MEVVFEGLGMLFDSWNLTQTSEVMNVLIWCRSLAWLCQIGKTAPPTEFQQSSPRSTFHLDVRNLVRICNIPRLKRNSQVRWPKLTRKSNILNFIPKCIFGHLQGSYFNELLLRIKQNNFKFCQTLMMRSCVNLEFSSNVAVAAQRILMCRHETISCCNSTVHGQISPKCHVIGAIF